MSIGRAWTTLLLVLVMGCTSQGEAPETDARSAADQAPRDSRGELPQVPQLDSYPELGLQLAPVMDGIKNARLRIRQDSGTVAADSAFIRLRRELQDRFEEVVAELYNQEFQADIWPAGAAAQARWRDEQRLERRPTPEEEARADSIIAVVRAHGVWTRRAEGDTYFSVDESVMLARLGPYLTRGMVDFLGMQVHEQRGPVADDGALLIPLNELTRRIRWAEGFRKAYPGSPVVDVVESRYRWYLAIYLAGLPNTQPFDWRTSELDPEWRESLEHYAENHADLDSGALASRYLELLEESGFKRNEEIVAFLSELWANVRLVRFP